MGSMDCDNTVINVDASLTPKEKATQCADICLSKGTSFMGMQWTGECFCGNRYGQAGEASDCGALNEDGVALNCQDNDATNCKKMNAVYKLEQGKDYWISLCAKVAYDEAGCA